MASARALPTGPGGSEEVWCRGGAALPWDLVLPAADDTALAAYLGLRRYTSRLAVIPSTGMWGVGEMSLPFPSTDSRKKQLLVGSHIPIGLVMGWVLW